jgi:HD-GYP domain-containing protein (c-di-GMP phosphodiesterase class II)
MQYTVLLCDHLSRRNINRENAQLVGLLHDVGKIGMRDNILLKESQLTDEEIQEMKRHPVLSAKILEPTTLPMEVIVAVRHHHERWDGTGYPDGLRGENIPLMARVVSIADAFDAMTSDRVYRPGMTCRDALHQLEIHAGTAYDPELVPTFVRVIRKLTPDENLRGKALASSLLGARERFSATTTRRLT